MIDIDEATKSNNKLIELRMSVEDYNLLCEVFNIGRESLETSRSVVYTSCGQTESWVTLDKMSRRAWEMTQRLFLNKR